MTKFFLTTSLATLMALPLYAMDQQDGGMSHKNPSMGSSENRVKHYQDQMKELAEKLRNAKSKAERDEIKRQIKMVDDSLSAYGA